MEDIYQKKRNEYLLDCTDAHMEQWKLWEEVVLNPILFHMIVNDIIINSVKNKQWTTKFEDNIQRMLFQMNKTTLQDNIIYMKKRNVHGYSEEAHVM